MHPRLGGLRCRLLSLLCLISSLQLDFGLTVLKKLKVGASTAPSDYRVYGFPQHCWPRPRCPLRAKHLLKPTLDDKLAHWWPELTFPWTPRRVTLLRPPEYTNAPWILIPWTKDQPDQGTRSQGFCARVRNGRAVTSRPTARQASHVCVLPLP